MPKLLFVKILCALAILAGFFYINKVEYDPDMWWHLKFGELTIQHGNIPTADPWSYTMTGFKGVNLEWFGDVLLWWLYAHNLWLIAIVGFTLAAFLPFALWLARVKSLFGTSIIVLMAASLIPILGVRHQIISFLLFVAIYEILDKIFSDEFNRKKRLWAYATLILIFLIWANVHAGFTAGFMLWGIFILMKALDGYLNTRRISLAKFLNLCLPFCTAFLATFINPYGSQIYKEIFTTVFSSTAMNYIQEWQPALISNAYGFAVIVAIFLFFAIKFSNAYSRAKLFSAMLFFIMFFKAVRFAPLFFSAAMPIFNIGEETAKREIGLSTSKQPLTLFGNIMLKYGGALLLVASLAFFLFSTFRYTPFKYPVNAGKILTAQAEKGARIKLLNNYGWGGYLIFHAPEIKIFIDGRMAYWKTPDGYSAMEDYIDIFYWDGWFTVFKKYEINSVLVANNAPEERNITPLKYGILKGIADLTAKFFRIKEPINIVRALQTKNWETVYKDDASILLQCASTACRTSMGY